VAITPAQVAITLNWSTAGTLWARGLVKTLAAGTAGTAGVVIVWVSILPSPRCGMALV
jgi:hypothetical protein